MPTNNTAYYNDYDSWYKHAKVVYLSYDGDAGWWSDLDGKYVIDVCHNADKRASWSYRNKVGWVIDDTLLVQ